MFFHMKFLVLILMLFSLSVKSQKILLDTAHKINTNFKFRIPLSKKSILSYKYQNLFAITMNANINKNVFQAPTLQEGLSTAFQYDFNTKFHINKKLNFIVRTQLSSASQIASFGLSFKLN